MYHIIKNQREKLKKISPRKDEGIEKQIERELKKEKICIIQGMKYSSKTKIIKNIIFNDSQKKYFYFNAKWDRENEIGSGKDLSNVLSGFINLYGEPDVVWLQNINKVAKIKDFIAQVFKKGYPLCIVGNGFYIDGKTPLQVLPDMSSADMYLGSIAHISKDIPKEQSILQLKNCLSDIILHEVVSHFGVKNSLLYSQVLHFLSLQEDFASLREIHRNISRVHDISLKTLIDYIDFSNQSKLIHSMYQYDCKKQKPISSQVKYMFGDTGLRNTCSEESVATGILQENMLYLLLCSQGYEVYGGKNGIFEWSIFGKHINKKNGNILIHISKQEELSEIKKEVKKLHKALNEVGGGKGYIILGNENIMFGKKKIYEDVEILSFEKCVEKLKIGNTLQQK
ncbi:hypothetical protein MK079_01170 [Candidatus Gracilibacteria bacterium]|nr:hypothetical protein [Candidatus Gracilibacteria bacterium]